MKFKLVFFFVLFFESDRNVKIGGSPIFTNVIPEKFSFDAELETSDFLCSGVLIMDNYVITPAYCVNGSSSINITLGYDEHHRRGPNTQDFYSTHILVHEEFVKTAQYTYLNNIAVVKLPRSAILNSNVRPVKLITSQEAEQLENSFVNVSGYMEDKNDKIIYYAKAQIENKDTCNYLYKENFFGNQQLCIRFPTKINSVRLGSTISINNKLIGFETNTLQCTKKDIDCSLRCLVLNVVRFSKWISQTINIPIEQFTTRGNDNIYELKKAEDSFKKSIQEDLNTLETKITEKNKIIEKQIHGKIDEVLNTVQRNTLEENVRLDKFKEVLNEQKEEVNKSELTVKHELDKQFGQMNITLENKIEEKFKIYTLKENKAQLKLQEEINTLEKVIQKNYLEESLQFGQIKALLDEQIINMNKHVIQEVAQLNSSWAEIKSLNGSVNKLISFIYDDPIPN